MLGISRVPIAFLAVVLSALATPADASLIGQTFNGNISITGSDDHGSYTIAVLNGPVTVPGPGDLIVNTPVFKQLTFMGFSTASNQINGNVILDIGANAISVTLLGQVQPFELHSVFTGIAGTITADVDSATGLIAGVNMDLSHSFTASSVDFATFYLGFQPGTNVKQTETLTFAPVQTVPEPSALVLFALGLLGVALVCRRRPA